MSRSFQLRSRPLKHLKCNPFRLARNRLSHVLPSLNRIIDTQEAAEKLGGPSQHIANRLCPNRILLDTSVIRPTFQLVTNSILSARTVMSRRFITNLFRNQTAEELLRSEDGNVAVEYALMLGLICGVLLSSVKMLGSSTLGTMNQIVKSLEPEPEYSTPGGNL